MKPILILWLFVFLASALYIGWHISRARSIEPLVGVERIVLDNTGEPVQIIEYRRRETKQ